MRGLAAVALFAAACAAFDARASEPEAMQHWARAVAEMGDLLAPAAPERFARGARAIARAKALGGRTERECELIDAVAQFYHRPEQRTHDMRLVYFERALSRARSVHPDDAQIAHWHDIASRAALARARERVEAAWAARRVP